MKRPDQHITETKSQRIFERIVPAEWVCREIKPDYGVDYLVEIFEDNQSTGKTFFVQLKGSTQEIKDDTFVKQITTDNLNYYNSLALPVIIICVSVSTEQIWGIWANKLIEQNQVKESQKTISVSLNNDYLLDESQLILIASQAELSNKLGLFTESNSDLTQSFNEHILRWIESFYSKSVSVKFNNLPIHLSIKHFQLNDSIETKLTTGTYSKTIEINGLNEELPFLHRPKFDANNVNDFNKDVLLSLAISLAKYDIQGTLNLLIKLVGKLDLINQEKWVEFDPLGLLILAKDQNEIHLYNRLVQEIIRIEKYELFLFFDLAYFVLGTTELQAYRIENLNTVIESTKDKQFQGTCHYNIGNIQRSNRGNAIEHYIKAAKLFPDYRKRDYWWREIAGLFFLNQHYHWAEVCYKESLKLSAAGGEKKYFRLEKILHREKNLVLALIADCLFIQGKFKDANAHFEKYFDSIEHIPQEWILKNMVCLELMEGNLNGVKFERKESIKLCETSSSLSNNEKIIELLTKATELHPTNGLAWFNLGVSLDKKENYDEALFAFLMTGLIQDGDKEAQFNALTISFTQQKMDLMQAILIYITEKHNENVINDLSDYIMQKNMPLDAKKGLIKAFNEMIEVTKTMHNKVYSA
jgi:tetratricopeptide (TPR) repeat protein